MPVQAPTKYQLVINLKTAEGVGPRRADASPADRRRGDRVNVGMSAFDPKWTSAAANHGTLNDARTSGSSSRLSVTDAAKRNFVALVTFGDQDFVTAAKDLHSLRCFLI